MIHGGWLREIDVLLHQRRFFDDDGVIVFDFVNAMGDPCWMNRRLRFSGLEFLAPAVPQRFPAPCEGCAALVDAQLGSTFVLRQSFVQYLQTFCGSAGQGDVAGMTPHRHISMSGLSEGSRTASSLKDATLIGPFTRALAKI